MIGTTLLNRYRLDSELGRGGMGVVYRAHDLLLDRDVAAKVLSASAMDSERRTRLLHEAQAAARLNHPGIVAIHDVVEADGVPFIVMELVEGESLHNRRPESLEQILTTARQICAALEHAHAHGIIHRDLKPENVMIAPDGTAKLMDFGLARSVASRLTSEGTIIGTVFYLAPEQALGQEVDGRADLYALGVMLYELTTGRLPFTADDPVAVISQHLYAPAVPPRSFRPDLPPALEAITLQLLAKDPASRPASAAEVARALADAGAVAAPVPEIGMPSGSGGIALLEQLTRGRLIGRRSELNQLRGLWGRAQQGHGHLALISGEPGIGKTRLAYELMVIARLTRAVVLRGGCYEYEATTPYLPFVAALREWVHAQDAESLRAHLGPAAPELARLAPEIESRLGPQPAYPALPPTEERLRLFDYVARFFQRLAAENGLLLFIDDLHWADQGTLALLHYLLRQLRDDRLLLLAAYREVELDRSHPLASALVDWNRERLTTRVMLGRLSPEESGALLATLFGQTSVTPEFVMAMFRETEGNPFFIEEVVKALVEQGQIYRENGGWGRREVAELAIPQSVKEAIGRRLNRLSQADVDLLHTAAALGKTFEFAELAAVTTTSEDQILDALDEVSAAQLIRAERGETFTFTHDKIREVLYEELNPIRRQRLHQRIGEALESLYASDMISHVQDLAHHFVQSGDLAKGLSYSMRAAQEAERLFAYDEALMYYERARETAEAMNLSEQLAGVYERMAAIHEPRGSFQAAVEAYERALALTPGSERRAAIKANIGIVYAAVGDERGVEFLQDALRELNPETQANALATGTAALGRYHHYHGQHKLAIEFLERARQLAEPLDDAFILTNIYGYLAGAYQHQARFDRSMEWARRCITLGERKYFPFATAIGYEFLAEDSFGLGKWREALEHAGHNRQIGEKTGAQVRVAWSEFSRAHAHYGLGDLQIGAAAAQSALRLAEAIGDQRLCVIAGAILAIFQTDLGEEEAARVNANLALERANELGQVYMLCESRRALAHLHRQREEWGLALELYEKCAEAIRNTDNRVALLYFGTGHAEACWGQGRLEEGERRAAEILTLTREAKSRHLEAVARRVQGQIYAAQQSWEQAARAFDEAIAILEELGSRLELGRAVEQRGMLRQMQGRTDIARQDLGRAQAIFDATGARRDAARTREHK